MKFFNRNNSRNKNLFAFGLAIALIILVSACDSQKQTNSSKNEKPSAIAEDLTKDYIQEIKSGKDGERFFCANGSDGVRLGKVVFSAVKDARIVKNNPIDAESTVINLQIDSSGNAGQWAFTIGQKSDSSIETDNLTLEMDQYIKRMDKIVNTQKSKGLTPEEIKERDELVKKAKALQSTMEKKVIEIEAKKKQGIPDTYSKAGACIQLASKVN